MPRGAASRSTWSCRRVRTTASPTSPATGRCATFALVGSANLDARSLFLNYELMVAFYRPGDVAAFAGWIDGERRLATAYRAQPPGLFRDLAEGLVLWLAFQL